jgi:glycine/D-amino acid oxidase-like deaminating enzyme
VSDQVGASRRLTGRRRFLKNSALVGGGALLGAGGLNGVSPWIWRRPLPLDANASYWARSQAPRNPALAEDLNVDVAILGGGLTGLSAAYYIRRVSPQKSVAVFEALGCGNGASGRNGAMVLTMTADRYMNFSGSPAMDKQIYDLTAANIRALSMLSAATRVDCELETNGALQVFNGARDAAAAMEYVRRARGLGMPVELWDARQVAQAIGTSVYEGAFFDPHGGHVQPMKLVRVFKTAAESAGAGIYENSRVAAVEEGREHLLHIESGGGARYTVRAKSLVLASNAFTPNTGFLRNAVMPLREYVAMTRPLSDRELGDIGWRLRAPFNDMRTEVFYLGLTRDRRIHIGGGTPRYRFNNGAGPAEEAREPERQLQRELVRIFPALAGVEFEANWSGVVDWSLDASPAVGWTGKHGNVFYGIGYSGHGVNLTSVFGRIIADFVAGRQALWRHYPFVNASLHYVPNEPFRWLAAEAGLAWYRLTE